MKALLFEMYLFFPENKQLKDLIRKEDYIENKKVSEDDFVKRFMIENWGMSEDEVKTYTEGVDGDIETGLNNQFNKMPILDYGNEEN